MPVLRIPNFQETTIRPIVSRNKHSIAFIFITRFSSEHQVIKLYMSSYIDFIDDRRESQMQNLRKKTDKNTLNKSSIVYFRYARLFAAKYSLTSTIHLGISADEYYAL